MQYEQIFDILGLLTGMPYRSACPHENIKMQKKMLGSFIIITFPTDLILDNEVYCEL